MGRRRAPTIGLDLAQTRPKREPFAALELEVITPLFGGSATPGQVDADFPIRGSSIRGSLRFWWRACHAPRYATPMALFKAEAELWGSGQNNGRSSAVDISVDITHPGTSRSFAYFGRRKGPLPYVLFPFRSRSDRAVAIEGTRFRLVLALAPHVAKEHAAEYAREADDAVWAWLTFGGVGARTRRGCGALAPPPHMRPGENPVAWLPERTLAHATPSTKAAPPLPVLDGARCLVYSDSRESPWTAWESAVELLRGFRRQQRVWPEAAAIRRMLQQQEPPAAAFPRADLGLPIVFQRMLSPDPVVVADAPHGARMASPVILKPLMLSSGRAVPLIVVLSAPHVSEAGARLTWSTHDIALKREQLESSAREELVDYIIQRSGWNEVRLHGGRAAAS